MAVNGTKDPITTNSAGNMVSEDYLTAQESKGIINADTGKALALEPATEQQMMPDPTPEENQAALDLAKKDWIETRLLTPGISSENLFEVYGAGGFKKFKSKDDYWDNNKIKGMFVDQYGYDAKYEFDKVYDNYKKEFAQFELGNFMRAKSGYELLRDDLSDLRATVQVRFENSAGALMTGDAWGKDRKDFRENFIKIRTKVIDDEGVESYKIVDYSSDALKDLENDPLFDGLAYSDLAAAVDPYAPMDGFVYESIYEGKILGPDGKSLVDVRDDQIVSRWDIETGNFLDGWFKNNKLEAEGFLDYAKIIIKSPANLAVNLLDTAVQLTRATWALGYGILNVTTLSDMKIDDSAFYKQLSSAGVRLKARTTSTSTEAMRDGYFGSLEASLQTTTDIIFQVALASGLGKLSAKATKIAMGEGASAASLARAQGMAAKISVRGTLTAMATKDSYNEALSMGFTNTEAAIYTGAIGGAMWIATSQANYIIGDYGSKHVRNAVREAIKNDLRLNVQPAVKRAIQAGLAPGSPEATKHFANKAVAGARKAIGKVFSTGKAGVAGGRKLLNSSQWIYEAKQEAIEEMSEELGQDIVKHLASAYGVALKDAQEIGKGRFTTFLDDGWFKHAAERYATSGVAGGIGGLVGMKLAPNRVQLSDITEVSSITEILQAGHGKQLIEALDKLKKEKKLGPETLAAEYNFSLEAFEPMLEGTDAKSLGDMVYDTYLHDINVIDTFINKGMFGKAREAMEKEFQLRESVDNNAMRKDFAEIMASIITFHNRTGITTKIYEEMDAMNDAQLTAYMPEALNVMQTTLKERRQELIEYRQKITEKKLKQGVQEDDDEEVVTDGIILKEDEDMAEGADLMLDHLKQRVQEVDGLGESDIKVMLENYKKMRAIASGASAEYYLLQNQVAENTVLGSSYNRAPEFKDLGKTPLRDMLFSMRFRLLDDKKNALYTQEKADEIESEITAMDGLTSDDVVTLEAILKENGDKLTKGSVDHVRDLYDKMTIPLETFDVNSPNSVFEKDSSGKPTKESISAVYLQLILLNDDNKRQEKKFGTFFHTSIAQDAEAFFKEAAIDSKELRIPEYMDDFYSISSDSNPHLIEAIAESGDIALSALINKAVPKTKMSFRALANNPRFAADAFYDPKGGASHPLQTILRTMGPKGFGVDTVLNKGLNEVVELLNSGMGPEKNIFTKSDTSVLEDVKRQTKIKEAFAKEVSVYTRPSGNTEFLHNITMLSEFRHSVLDIINFKYKLGTVPNSRIEEHPYKEYTAFSDFFVDFIYDPVRVKEVLLKEEDLRTEEDKDVLERLKAANLILLNNNGTDPYTIDVPTEAMKLAFLQKFGNLDGVTQIRNAVDFLKDPKSELIVTHEGENYYIKMNGLTALRAADTLFEKAVAEMEAVKSADSPLPYIKEKEREVRDAFKIYTKMFGGNDDFGNFLGEMVNQTVPQFRDILDNEGPKKVSTIELGKINIAVEKALFDIYNGNVTMLSDPRYDGVNLKMDMDLYIKDIAGKGREPQNAPDNILNRKAGSLLIGAITTDFTPFYAKFKGILNSGAVDDKVVIAAQEQTAKYAAAYIYSEKFKKYTHETFSKGTGGSYIKGIYGSGTAGSGKSSATIELGANIGVSVLKDQGHENIAVLPVANNISQIEILEGSVGELSLGNKGLTPTQLEDLLKVAVNERGDEADVAIEKLKKIGVIVIDEVTYIKAYSIDDNLPQLQNITALIEAFNKEHNAGGHTISLVMLGDPKQSGAFLVSGDTVASVSLIDAAVFSLNYMDFSFRNRNTFLTSSLDAIQNSAPKLSTSNIQAITGVTLKPGLKYGSLEGRKYGVNLYSAKDVDSSNDFMTVMRDPKMVSNIKANMDASIAANKDKNPGDKDYEKPFSVIISPSSKTDFEGAESAMMTQLIKDPVYAPFIKVIDYSLLGGSEANYVFAEIPKLPFDNQNVAKNLGFARAMHKSLNTLATRAFDYAHIVDRSGGINIPTESRAKEMADKEVIIPNTKIDDAAKQKVKEHYLGIMADINADGSILPVTPSVIITDTEEFVVPENINRALIEINAKLIANPASVMHVAGFTAILEDIGDTQFEGINTLMSSLRVLKKSDGDNILANYDLAIAALGTLKDFMNTDSYAEFEFAIASARILSIDPGDGTVSGLFDKQIDIVSDIINIGIEEYFALYPTSNAPISEVMKGLQKEFNTNANNHKKVFGIALSPGTRDEAVYKTEVVKMVGEISTLLSDSEKAVRDPKKVSKDIKDKIWAIVSGITELAADIHNNANITEQVLEDSDHSSVTGFEGWLDTKTSDEILDVIVELDRLASVESLVGETIELDITGHARTLLETYSSESVLGILKEVAALRYQIKRTQEDRDKPPTIEDFYAEFEALKIKSGIGSTVLGKNELKEAIQSLEEKAKVSQVAEEIYNVEKLKELYDKVFATTVEDKFDKNDTWYNRGIKRAEKLEDYVARRIADSQGNHIYTIPIQASTIKNVDTTKSFTEGVTYKVYEDPADMLNLFGYGMKGTKSTLENAPRRIGLRAVKTGDNLNIFLIGITGDTRHVMSQIFVDNTNSRTTPEVKARVEALKSKGDYPIEIIEKIKSIMASPGNDPRVNSFNGDTYFDLEMNDKAEQTLLFRAGAQTMPKQGESGNTLAGLKAKGINIDSHMYVYTRVTSSLEKNELLGEAYVMYTPNNAINLREQKIRKANLNGTIVANGKVIVDYSAVVPTEIGMLPVHIEPNFVRLGEALSKVDVSTIGEMPTKMSLLIQKHIGNYIGQFKADDVLEIVNEGNVEKLGITAAVVNQGLSMSTGYINHTNGRRKDLRDSIEKSYDTMMKSPKLKGILDELSAAYVSDYIASEGKTRTILYKQADGDAYILAINKQLKNNDKVFLGYLTEIAAIVGYSIKPTISAGKSVNVGLINDIFVKELSDLIKVVPTNIELPTAQINAAGKTAIMQEINAVYTGPGKQGEIQTGFEYKGNQKERRDQILNFRATILGVKGLTALEFAEVIKKGEELLEDLDGKQEMEQEADAIRAGIKEIQIWENNLKNTLLGREGILNDKEYKGSTLYKKVFRTDPEGNDLESARAVALSTVLFYTNLSEDSLDTFIGIMGLMSPESTFEDISKEVGENMEDDADESAIQALLNNKCAI